MNIENRITNTTIIKIIEPDKKVKTEKRFKKIYQTKVKLIRAKGECLGIKNRRRT